MKSLHKSLFGMALSVALCAAPVGFAATTTTLNTLADWNVYGSGSASGSSLVFGDVYGYDSADADGDGNPSNVWNEGNKSAGQALDYDWAVSKKEFKAPLTVNWSGCLPTTKYGYNWMLIGKRDPAFSGAPSSRHDPMWPGIGFMTRWENQNALHISSSTGGVATIAPVKPSSGNICGDFKVVWRDKIAQFYFNNTLVNQQSYTGWYGESVVLGFRSFEKSISVTAVSVIEEEGSASNAPLAVTAPTKLDFGSQKIGITSTPQVVKLSNGGTGMLSIRDIAADSSDFVVKHNCATNLAAGGGCEIYVQFSPTAAGSRSATLTVNSDNPGGALSVALSGTGSAAQEYLGAMLGSITGSVVTADGKTVTPQCSPSVDVTVSDADGKIGAVVTGTIVCDAGVVVNFTANYDAATQALSGTYSDNLGNSGKAIKFTQSGDLTWTASVSGTTSQTSGVKSYSATVTINLPPQALFAGKYNGKLSGPIQATNPISIPLNIPELGINQTLSFNLIIEGTWEAKLVPSAKGTEITGKVSGTLKGDQAIHILGKVDLSKYVPAGIPGVPTSMDVPIDIDINETFSGTLFGNLASNNLTFKGFATQMGKPVSFEMAIPLDAGGGIPNRMNFSLGGSMPVSLPSGSLPSYIPASMVPSSMTLPTSLGNGQIPFTINP